MNTDEKIVTFFDEIFHAKQGPPHQQVCDFPCDHLIKPMWNRIFIDLVLSLSRGECGVNLASREKLQNLHFTYKNSFVNNINNSF